MTRIVTAFHSGPEGAKGNARDMRVRWALEEAGLPYETHTIDFASHEQARAEGQPFGQIPTYRDGTVDMFESGAIVLHIAEDCEALLPVDPRARARAMSWLFAALNTVEPATWSLLMLHFLKPDWADAARPSMIEAAQDRLKTVSEALGDKDWLEGRFTVGDLMMVSVIRHIRGSGVVDAFPNLLAFVKRGEARPAFQRALAANRADFDAPSQSETP